MHERLGYACMYSFMYACAYACICVSVSYNHMCIPNIKDNLTKNMITVSVKILNIYLMFTQEMCMSKQNICM